MKKLFVFAAAAMMSVSAMATVIYEAPEGEPRFVTWGQGLQIDSTKFAGLTTPHEMIVTFEEATDGIEFKRTDTWDQLYFPQFLGISGDGSISKLLTPDALEVLSHVNLEMIGNHFYVVKVELVENLEYENHLWKGYAWMEEWSTIELNKVWYASIDWDEVAAIRCVSEANRTDYVINVMTSWDGGDKLGDQTTMTMTNEYAELELTADMRTKLAASEQLMIQCNKEAGDPFNMTEIVLIMNEPSAVETNRSVKATKAIENGKMVILKNGVRFNALGAKL